MTEPSDPLVTPTTLKPSIGPECSKAPVVSRYRLRGGKRTLIQKIARNMLRHRKIPALTHTVGTRMELTWMECATAVADVFSDAEDATQS
jgi:hypothetical protein